MKLTLINKCNFTDVFIDCDAAPDCGSNGKQPRKKVGHFRAQYRNSHWNDEYCPCRNELKDKTLMTESLEVLSELEKMFSDLNELRDYCKSGNAEKIGDEEYNCYYNGEYGNYWIRLNTWSDDYNIYCHIYIK